MSDLTDSRDHFRKMQDALHKPGCLAQPRCDGCITQPERDLFRRLADEIDTYLRPSDDDQPMMEF
jgi:hypothetical protein